MPTPAYAGVPVVSGWSGLESDRAHLRRGMVGVVVGFDLAPRVHVLLDRMHVDGTAREGFEQGCGRRAGVQKRLGRLVTPLI